MIKSSKNKMENFYVINAIKSGIRKVNYYTKMAKVGTPTMENMVGKSKYFHDFVLAVETAIKEDIKQAIRIFEAKS